MYMQIEKQSMSLYDVITCHRKAVLCKSNYNITIDKISSAIEIYYHYFLNNMTLETCSINTPSISQPSC